MGMWFYMLVLCLLFPAIMLFAGKLFMIGKPKKVNWVIGYRSDMSTKNEETWRFAHKIAGRFWWKWGWPCLGLTGIGMLCVWGRGENVVSVVGLSIMCAMMIPLLAVIPHTEKQLRKTFDKNGNKKETENIC